MKKNVPFIFLFVLMIAGCRHHNDAVIDLESKPVEPELFGKGIVSTNMYERDIAISPKGDEIVFTLSDYGQTRRCLVMISKNGNRWSSKKILSFSGKYADIEPFFSTDGNKLFFASDRPVNADDIVSDYNIWVSERSADGWDDPTPLPSNINTNKDEFYPSVSSNGNLYFTAQHDNSHGGEDIFVSKYINGQYLAPIPLDSAINTRGDEFNAYVNPEENLIIFGSYGRADGQGGVDLYISRKDASGNWTPALNMGPEINSEKLDFCPFIDTGRGNFYFTSDRILAPVKQTLDVKELELLSNDVLNGMGNIYKVSLESIGFK